MSDATHTPVATALPRASLALVSALHAGALGWAAWVLPWREGTAFALTTGALAIGHGVLAALAGAGARGRRSVWRVLAWGSLAWLAWLAWRVGAAAAYVAALYGDLGRGVAVAVAAAGAACVLFTLPFACWGLARTGGVGGPRRAGPALALLALLGALGLWQASARARALPPDAALGPEAITRRLAAALSALPAAPAGADPISLYTPEAARCAAPPRRAPSTLLVTFAARRGGAAVTRCLQAEPEALGGALAALLAAQARGGAVKLDWVTGVQPLADHDLPGVDALALRPGLDGVCRGGRCLAPWQLVALDQFGRHRPLPFVRDLRFGISAASLRALLGEAGPPPDRLAGLARIETASFVRTAGGALRPLRRLRGPGPEVADAARAAAAARAAQRHVLAAQRPDGSFRYTLDPFTGRADRRPPHPARQAGTTLVLCELGEGLHVDGAARRALGFLARSAHWSAERAALARDPRRAHAGPAALTLAALLACRPRAGSHHDALIGGLGRLLLDLQRGDGGFHPAANLATGAPRPGPEPLFAGGQIVLALVGLEALARSGDAPAAALPAADEIGRAVSRAMHWYATRYWSHALADFFFLEENWHCLAARAALPHHRDDAYERFCLDYVAFKSRLVLGAEARVAPELVGGYGFGNVVPPHNTPTAGFAEALAAAMALRRARGEDATEERRQMAQVLGFLLRRQWNEADCFACAPGRAALGGFSESMASPRIRIDYVQHAWAALGHGGPLLAEDG